MKIYFNISARGFDKYRRQYLLIEKVLLAQGHMLVWDWRNGIDKEKIYTSDEDEMAEVFKEALVNINKADVFVAEVSVPSVTQGFLIDKALSKEKHVVALAYQGSVPAFLKGVQDQRFCLVEYSDETINDVLRNAFDLVSDHVGSRFTMIMPDNLLRYLDTLPKRGLSRSEYIRRLIEKDMEGE